MKKGLMEVEVQDCNQQTAFSTWSVTVSNQIESFSLPSLYLPVSFDCLLKFQRGGGRVPPMSKPLFKAP